MKEMTRMWVGLMFAGCLMAAPAGAQDQASNPEVANKPEGAKAGRERPGLQKAVEQLLRERPEIVLSVLENNPVQLADLVERASEIRKAKIEEEQLKQELQNPKMPEVSDARPVRGPRSAPVTIVEYSDFQCPYCQAASRTLQTLLAAHGTEVRLVYKHNPLPFHAAAEPAARYFEAIALQSEAQAWRFHDQVFEQQEALSGGEDTLQQIAAGLEIDTARLARDLTSPAVLERLRSDQAEAAKFGFDGTPAFLINGVALIGNQPEADFDRIIKLFAPERQAMAR